VGCSSRTTAAVPGTTAAVCCEKRRTMRFARCVAANADTPLFVTATRRGAYDVRPQLVAPLLRGLAGALLGNLASFESSLRFIVLAQRLEPLRVGAMEPSGPLVKGRFALSW
jgi:hypothetical protein